MIAFPAALFGALSLCIGSKGIPKLTLAYFFMSISKSAVDSLSLFHSFISGLIFPFSIISYLEAGLDKAP